MSLLNDLPSEYKHARLPRKEQGAVIANGVQVASTTRCVHCGGHFMVTPGSGIERGWCHHCGGSTCGKTCNACVPFELWLEAVERRATREMRGL